VPGRHTTDLGLRCSVKREESIEQNLIEPRTNTDDTQVHTGLKVAEVRNGKIVDNDMNK